jgi:hypothetical protein
MALARIYEMGINYAKFTFSARVVPKQRHFQDTAKAHGTMGSSFPTLRKQAAQM